MIIEYSADPVRVCISCREPLEALVETHETSAEDVRIVAHATCKKCGAWARVCAPGSGYKITQAALAALTQGGE